MSDHNACSQEAEFLRKSLDEIRASALNYQKQLATKSAALSLALSAGENAAREADRRIERLSDIIDQLFKRIYKMCLDKGMSQEEIDEFTFDLPGWSRPNKIGER